MVRGSATLNERDPFPPRGLKIAIAVTSVTSAYVRWPYRAPSSSPTDSPPAEQRQMDYLGADGVDQVHPDTAGSHQRQLEHTREDQEHVSRDREGKERHHSVELVAPQHRNDPTAQAHE